MFNFIKEAMAPTTRSNAKTEYKDLLKENPEKVVAATAADAAGDNGNYVDTKPIKGYKITDNERTRKFGIGANSLQMLKTKAKLKFPIKDLRIYLASDGFEVTDEDYFTTLESQTLFIVADPEAIITTDSDFEFEQLRQKSPLLKVADIIYEFMEKQPDKFGKLIAEYEKKKKPYQKMDQTKTLLSLKSEHVEWFSGLDERCHTKEEALQKKAQDRVKCYYYKAKDELTRNHLYRQNLKARQIIDSVLEKFRYLLIGCDYFNMIFNRKCEHKHEIVKANEDDLDDETDARAILPKKKLKQVIREYTARHQILDEWTLSLCTDLGDFYCQGAYSDQVKNCTHQHTINPYASRENLILFQVWNLDHQIELSRTILPSLIENIEELATTTPKPLCSIHEKPAVDVSVLEYFLEIFSLKNLKLVHIVCHEKTHRSNKSNGRLLCKHCHEYKIVEELMKLDYDYNPDDW